MNFIVIYKGVVIGKVENDHYYPDMDSIKKQVGVFSFLKEEISNIMEHKFFKTRIENCSRFSKNDCNYSGDNYIFREI